LIQHFATPQGPSTRMPKDRNHTDKERRSQLRRSINLLLMM